MDLSNSVIIPREDFLELQQVAWSQTPTEGKERVASVVQTAAVFAIIAAAITAGTWGWAKAMEWREKKSFERMTHEPEFRNHQ